MLSRGLTAGGVILALLLTAGCGDDTTSDPVSPRVVTAAAQTTEAARSLRLSLETEAKLPGTGESITFTGDGLSDATGGRGRLVLDLSSVADVAGVEGESENDPDNSSDAFRAEEVLDGPVLYVSFPALSAQLPGARQWLSIDARKPLPGAEGLDLSQLAQLGGDAARSLDQLRAIGPGVTRVGSDTVRGVQAEHYRGTVQLRRYPDLVAPPGRDAARATVEQLVARTGIENVPTDVWVDSRRLVRRIRQRIDGKSAAGEPIQLETTIELFDFGIPIAVTPPPADQVSDLSELAQSASQ